MSRRTFVPVSDLTPSEQLAFLSLAMRDQRDAAAAAHQAAIHDPKNPDLRPAFFCLAEISVIRYLRPFKSCRVRDERTSTCLELGEIQGLTDDDGKAEAFHKALETIRDKIAAHTDLTDRGLILLPSRDSGKNIKQNSIAVMVDTLNLTPSNLSALRDLASALHLRLLSRVMTLVKSLHPDLLTCGNHVQLLGAPAEDDRFW